MLNAREEQAVRYLRGEENPFDAFVVSDRPPQEFPQCHVAEVHYDEMLKITRVIEKYRHPDYAARRQLHGSRSLLVRGVRGSGKTHLLHVLRQRDTATPEVWICPRHYDASFPFAEYLLNELVRTLLSGEDPESAARLRWCADEVARRLLAQAVAIGGPQEWPEWTRVREPTGRRIRRRSARWSEGLALLRRLGDGPVRPSVADVCAQHGLSNTAAYALMLRHIERLENRGGTAGRMRRAILLGLADLAVRGSADPLILSLEQGFDHTDNALPPARADVVASLLQTLVEVLAAIGVPVVFAFDNMERLLAPRGPVDLPAAQSFLNGLAHVIDQTTGLLVILFVETGLWAALQQAINTFADHRLRQGVRVRDYGCVWEMDLNPPTPELIEQVVKRRMRPLLAGAPGGEGLSPCFPFDAAEVRTIAAAGTDVLRTALLRLRDRYDELVLPADQRPKPPGAGESGAAEPSAPPAPTFDALREDWERASAAARRRLQASRRTSFAQELHAGLGRWLDLLVGHQVHGWELQEVKSAVPFGEHPTFGLLTVVGWRDSEDQTRRVGIAPILGEGRSMPRDLEIKFSSLSQRRPLADELVVLWPVAEGTITVDRLPPATRLVWDQLAQGSRVRLAALTLVDFAWLVGFPEWDVGVGAKGNGGGLRQFLLDRTEFLLNDLLPCALVEVSS